MSGDVFGVPTGEWYRWHLVGGGQDAAKPPTVHRTDPQQTLSQNQVLLALRLEAAPAFLEVSLALTLKNKGFSQPLSTTEAQVENSFRDVSYKPSLCVRCGLKQR